MVKTYAQQKEDAYKREALESLRIAVSRCIQCGVTVKEIKAAFSKIIKVY